MMNSYFKFLFAGHAESTGLCLQSLKIKTLSYCQEFACNGTVVEHPEYGEIIQLQGDQRENMRQFFVKTGFANNINIKVCVFNLEISEIICSLCCLNTDI